MPSHALLTRLGPVKLGGGLLLLQALLVFGTPALWGQSPSPAAPPERPEPSRHSGLPMLRCGALTLPALQDWKIPEQGPGLEIDGVSLDYRLNYFSRFDVQAWVSVYEAYLPPDYYKPKPNADAGADDASGNSSRGWKPLFSEPGGLPEELANPKPDPESNPESSPDYEPRYPLDPQLKAEIWRSGGNMLSRTVYSPDISEDDTAQRAGLEAMHGESILYRIPGVQGDRLWLKGLATLIDEDRQYNIYYNIPAGQPDFLKDMLSIFQHARLRGERVLADYGLWLTSDVVHSIQEHIQPTDGALPTGSTALEETEDGVNRRRLPIMSHVQQAAAQQGADELANKHRESLAIVKGAQGAGSAFLCRWGDKFYIISNIHVIAADQTGKITTLSGEPLVTEEAWAAVGHDIMRFTAEPNETISLEVVEDFDEEVRIGDDIVVLGNPEGAGVVQPLPGRVVGIGPDRVEVDAEFVPGNSGSPIIHLKSGKVIAIATYIRVRDRRFLEEQEFGEDEVEFRRFGYRLDSVKKWQPVNWGLFFAQAGQVRQVEALSMDIMRLLWDLDVRTGENLNLYAHRNPALRDAVREYVDQHKETPRMSATDRRRVAERFIRKLKSAALSDIPQVKDQQLYDYFENIIRQETELRDRLNEDFENWLRMNIR